MKKFKKKILVMSCIAIILIGSLIQIQNDVVITNGLKNGINLDDKSVRNERDNNLRSQNSQNDGDDPNFPPDFWETLSHLGADDWGYEEWKKYVIVDYCNLIEEEFYQHSKNDPEVNHILNVIIRLLWGTYNGTLSEAERMNLSSQLSHNSVAITQCELIQSNDFEIIIDLTYYVYSPWFASFEAETLEVRLGSTNINGRFREIVSPWGKLYFHTPLGFTDYYYYTNIGNYPMDSGVRLFHKYLDTIDHNVYDDKGWVYHERIKVPTGFVESNLIMDVILAYSFFVFPGGGWSSRSIRFKPINVNDDDSDPPELLNFQARFEGSDFNEPSQLLTIFSKPNGKPLNSVDKDIFVRINYLDYSGIIGKRLQFRFISKVGTVLYQPIIDPIWDRYTDLFWIPKGWWGLGWRWYYDLGDLDKIQIRSKASDFDNDRSNDTLTSGWTDWIDVAQVVRNELRLEGNNVNIQFEYSKDILKQHVKYNPYVGENISFSLKSINGYNNSIQINEIKYAVVSEESPSTPIYITQKLPDFEIGNYGSASTPIFNTPELLAQFDTLGRYIIYIKVNFTLLTQDFVVSFQDSFEIIAPEPPIISFFREDVKLNYLGFTFANMHFMDYKDMLFNWPTITEWIIDVKNPSRLRLLLNDTLRFELHHIAGRSPDKLQIKTGNVIEISVAPLSSESYPFTLEIADTTVFPPVVRGIKEESALIFEIFEIFTQFFSFLDFLEIIEMVDDLQEIFNTLNLLIDLVTFLGQLQADLESKVGNFDLFNEFNLVSLTGDTSWKYISSNEEEKFLGMYVNLFNTTKLNNKILITLSKKQTNDMIEHFNYQWIILGVDIGSMALGFVALLTGGNPIIWGIVQLGMWIVKEILKAESNEAKRRCDDPEPPKGDYTKSVVRNYTKVVIPREFENNLRYTQLVYDLSQCIEDLKVEREVQQEIRNRMNKALADNETTWALFQMDDLRKSIKLETEYKHKYFSSLMKFNTLLSEDMVNSNITDQDLLYVESYVEQNGVPLELIQLLDISEELEKEITWNLANISEYQFIDVNSPNGHSYAEYYQELNIELEKISEFSDQVNEDIDDSIVEESISLSIESGIPSHKLNETDIMPLETLNQSITEKIALNEWINVIDLCDELIQLTKDLALQIGNSSHPTLVSYGYYAQTTKKNAFQNNREHLFVSSPNFNIDHKLEREMTGIAKIDMKLVNASGSNTVELSINNLMGSYRFLDEDGAEITQITLDPNITTTIFLEYFFNEDVEIGTHFFDVIFKELNYNSYYQKRVTVHLVEDDDTTPPVITIDYMGGNGTDGSHGVWDVFAYDRESVIDNDRIEVYINDILIGNSFGVYDVPVILGNHTIRVEVWNNDATISEFAEKLAHQLIVDDDIIIPSLIIETVGCIDDEMSGNWHIIAEDSSGILEIGLTIDGITSIFTQEDFGIVELVELFIPIDNQLGNHECFGYVTDADLDRGSEDRLTFEHDSVYCTIIDDDETPPTISYSYDGDGTDGSPGVITISAYDSSGLSVDPSGTIIVPNSLGIHEFEFIAVDNDSDRPEDSLSSIISISILIIDDDTTSPLIHITYNGNGLDNNPGCFEWMISDLDDLIGGDHDTGFSEISIKVLYESSEGLPNQEYILSPSDIGTWTLPPFLGTYTLMISATDNDDDRTLLLDSLTTELDQSQEIKDDDSDPPILSNLVILDTIHDISISFEAFDVSGIKEVIINIDDEFINTYDELLGGSFTFEIINYWIMEFGIHYIEIEVWDADEDRVNDPLSSLISGTFTTSLEEMKQYNLWEVDQLFEMIYESSDDCWQKKNDKATMINKLNELKELISENNFEEAYDKLLHDIKPKLTGLKTDENEEPWGNGVFKNPWVTCPELQEIFRVICNEILTEITVLIQTISTLEYNGLNYFNAYNSIVLNVNGMGGFYGYNIFLLIGVISIIPLFSYFRRKKK